MIRNISLTSFFLFGFLGACGSDEIPEGTPELPLARRFALGTTILGDAPATYVRVLSSVPEGGVVSLESAREYAGFATIAARDSELFVSDGSSPRVRRYSVGSDDSLADETVVAFDAYGLPSVPLYTNVFVDAEHAYVQREQTRRIAWNPSAMTIQGEVATGGPEVVRGGKPVRAGYDRSMVVRGGDILQPYYWSDADYYAFDAQSQIARYDRDSGTLLELIDAPCPGLDVASVAPNGDVFFSNWVFAAAAPALDAAAPKTCTLRLRAGANVFTEDARIDLASLVGTEDTVAYRVLRDGSALVSVLAREELPNRELTPADITGGAYWRLFRVAEDGSSAAPVQGLPLIAAGYYMVEVDERTLVFVTSADYATTTVYDVRSDGTATAQFQVTGWAYQVVPLP